jgi:hypothetical protein
VSDVDAGMIWCSEGDIFKTSMKEPLRRRSKLDRGNFVPGKEEKPFEVGYVMFES